MNAKEQYIRQVKKVLTGPRAKKEEILRDLQEAFDSALEHGETDQDVIERLGSPAEFAGDIENQRGIKRKKHGKTALIWVLALLSAVLLAIYAVACMMRPPENAIGQANAMTSIQVYSDGLPVVPALLLLLGTAAGAAVALAAALTLFLCGCSGAETASINFAALPSAEPQYVDAWLKTT